MPDESNGKSNTTPFMGTRKLIKYGNSVCMVIPKEFIETNDLHEGDEVIVLANTDMLVSKKNADKVKMLHEKVEELIKNKD